LDSWLTVSLLFAWLFPWCADVEQFYKMCDPGEDSFLLLRFVSAGCDSCVALLFAAVKLFSGVLGVVRLRYRTGLTAFDEVPVRLVVVGLIYVVRDLC
jgi:hypothetical protein